MCVTMSVCMCACMKINVHRPLPNITIDENFYKLMFRSNSFHSTCVKKIFEDTF
jgi:hypothetical protein